MNQKDKLKEIETDINEYLISMVPLIDTTPENLVINHKLVDGFVISEVWAKPRTGESLAVVRVSKPIQIQLTKWEEILKDKEDEK